MVPLRDIKGEEIDRNSLFEYLHYTTIIVTWVMLGVRKLHIQMEIIRKTTKQKRKQSFKANKKAKKRKKSVRTVPNFELKNRRNMSDHDKENVKVEFSARF